MSRQRDEILNVIACSDKLLSAEEIFMHFKGIGENISIATIYRNLNILSDKGFIKKYLWETALKDMISQQSPTVILYAQTAEA